MAARPVRRREKRMVMDGGGEAVRRTAVGCSDLVARRIGEKGKFLYPSKED